MTRSSGRPLTNIALLLLAWVGSRLFFAGFRSEALVPPAPTPEAHHPPAEIAASSEMSVLAERSRPERDLWLAPEHTLFSDVRAIRANFASWPEVAQPTLSPKGVPEATQISQVSQEMPLPSTPFPLVQLSPFPAQASLPVITKNPRKASQNGLSLSFWTLFRAKTSVQTLAGGELGGSQIGMRFNKRLTPSSRAISLTGFGRVSRPISGLRGSEAALGISGRLQSAPGFELSFERRVGLEKFGRNAWAVSLNGGVYDQTIGRRLRLNAYVQTGIVGARRRDGFFDGEAIIAQPVGNKFEAGIGGWVSVQPRLRRVDIGPAITTRQEIAGETFRLSFQWRQRISGNAAPASGPAITIGADF